MAIVMLAPKQRKLKNMNTKLVFSLNKFSYFARNQCFCGNSYGSQGPSVNCTMTCSGNPNETCGGPWSNSVYDTMAYLGYLGCFSFYECKVQNSKAKFILRL